jgi:catechol 2,3-dioxygenase-like lactoylglutathione lyase family enzyme
MFRYAKSFNTMTVLRPHISIDVADIERSREFYQILFDQQPEKIRPGYVKFSLTEPALNFTLNERGKPSGSGSLNHLGIEVGSPQDVLMAQLRLEKAGLLPREEKGTNCCYAIQDKIWVEDPDGNQWEIFTVTMSDEEGDLRGTTSAACCVPASEAIAASGAIAA